MPLLTLLTAAGVATGSLVLCETLGHRHIHAAAAGGGTITATILVEVSNDPTGVAPWLTLATITLAGAGGATVADGFSTPSSWPAIRARVTAASLTSATITMAV